MTQYEQALQALEERGLLVSTSRGIGVTRMARCPGPLHHRGDQRPSLSVNEGDDGRALLYCFAGCEFREVAEELALEPGSSTRAMDVAAYYYYLNEDGEPVLRVTRLRPKGFLQHHWDGSTWAPGGGQRLLYNLPSVLDAEHVYLVEGEKDAQTVMNLGEVGTSTPGGAGNWGEEYIKPLLGKHVTIISDMDEVGMRKASERQEALQAAGIECNIVYPAVGNDLTDHVNAGLGLSDLLHYEPVDLTDLGEVDWETYQTPDTEWLLEPYLPRASRVLAFGPAGSLKSLWAMWAAAKLSQEGHDVAYISLEMPAGTTVRRLKQCSPDPNHFRLFTHFELDNGDHYRKLRRALDGYSLLVVDSFTAAGGTRPGQESNQAVADMDKKYWMPLIEETGITVLLLDNTGHGTYTKEGDYIAPQHARGASAKGDKMEVTIGFTRSEYNNYRTTLRVHKMRLDRELPNSLTIETPRDHVEFFEVHHNEMSKTPAWPGDRVEVDYERIAESVAERVEDEKKEATLSEKLAAARDKAAQRKLGDTLDEVIVTEASLEEAERAAFERLKEAFDGEQ